MRTLKICRPKHMEAALNKLIAELDGQRVGVLKNGGEVSVSMDDKAHELYIHGGALTGKGFTYKLPIPSGSYSYTFQIDMLSISGYSSSYKPVLRPCGDVPLANSLRTVLLTGATLTAALLDDKLRAALRGMPDAQLQLMLDPEQWRLDLCLGPARKAVLTQPYSQTTGGLIGALQNTIDHMDLHTPEDRAKLAEKILNEYVSYLPDYSLTGPNSFVLNAKA